MSQKPSANRDGTQLTPRGAKRRRALIDAALRIIVREGPGAVTLRTVVNEAGAAHGSVGYYFGSREDLIREALEDIAARNVEALAEAWKEIDASGDNVREIARLIAKHSSQRMISNREMGITIVELHLAAARYPELRPALRHWGRSYAAIASKTLATLGSLDPEADAAMLTNGITGLVLGDLALPHEDFEGAILQPFVERTLKSIKG